MQRSAILAVAGAVAVACTSVSGLTSRVSNDASADSPIGYWRFDETSGIKAKDEVGGNDGTYQGAIPIGTVLDFGGKSEITVEAWVLRTRRHET